MICRGLYLSLFVVVLVLVGAERNLFVSAFRYNTNVSEDVISSYSFFSTVADAKPHGNISRAEAAAHLLQDNVRPISKFMRKRWPNKTVPVSFKEDFPTYYRKKVYRAMDLLNKLTCVRFTNATDPKTYSVRIKGNDRACYAALGYRNAKKGFQESNLHPVCFNRGIGTVIHELIHTVGFHHQQIRVDRDEHLTVHEDRIQSNRRNNFKKTSKKNAYLMTFGLPYDYNSIMQYPLTAFNIGKGPTMSLKSKKFSGLLGQRSGPSRGDIAAINRYYECWDHYLGDDIRWAVPYKEFHAGYIALTPEFSERLRAWTSVMKAITAKSVEQGKSR